MYVSMHMCTIHHMFDIVEHNENGTTHDTWVNHNEKVWGVLTFMHKELIK